MHIKTLEIRNFRNIDSMRLDFSSGTNLIWGNNAQGKTNILEALYFCITGRSFRTRNESDCIPWEAPPDTYAILKAEAMSGPTSHSTLVSLGENRKYLEIDGKRIGRLGDIFGKINAVLFTPDDLSLLKGPPSVRRRFLDMEICQVDRRYLHSLQQFGQTHRQRNALIRQARYEKRPVDLDPWDALLAEHGAVIYTRRAEFISQMTDLTAAAYAGITSGNESLKLRYASFLGGTRGLSERAAAEAYAELLKENRESDLDRVQTAIGPHRDDLQVFIQTFDARTYASQGQQRSAALALKLAEIELLSVRTGHVPVLLLDDVTSELDPARRNALFECVRFESQTFITATEKDVVSRQVSIDLFFHIDGGICKGD